jgi:hypothetical protein
MGTVIVQWYMVTGIVKGYTGAAVVQGNRSTGMVQLYYRGAEVVQGYTGTGLVQGYRSSTGVQKVVQAFWSSLLIQGKYRGKCVVQWYWRNTGECGTSVLQWYRIRTGVQE